MISFQDIAIHCFRPFWFRGKARVLNALVKHQGIRSATIFGHEMELDLADQIQRNVYFGTFEPQETQWVKNLLAPGMTFVDVGANIGYFTALASSCVGPSGQILAIEPSPYAFSKLKKWVSLEQSKRFLLENVGVSDQKGQSVLSIPPEHLGNHSPTLVPFEGSSKVEICVTTLDALAQKWHLEKIDLLKLDIEGFELHALQGAVELLSDRRIRAMLCEFNVYWLKQAGVSAEALLKCIEQNGFSCQTEFQPLSPGAVVTYLFVLK